MFFEHSHGYRGIRPGRSPAARTPSRPGIGSCRCRSGKHRPGPLPPGTWIPIVEQPRSDRQRPPHQPARKPAGQLARSLRSRRCFRPRSCPRRCRPGWDDTGHRRRSRLGADNSDRHPRQCRQAACIPAPCRSPRCCSVGHSVLPHPARSNRTAGQRSGVSSHARGSNGSSAGIGSTDGAGCVAVSQRGADPARAFLLTGSQRVHKGWQYPRASGTHDGLSGQEAPTCRRIDGGI